MAEPTIVVLDPPSEPAHPPAQPPAPTTQPPHFASPTSGGSAGTAANTITKLSAQLKKLNEANGKYKNLLKLAKERIQKQEEEIDHLRSSVASAAETTNAAEEKKGTDEFNVAGASYNRIVLDEDRPDTDVNITRIVQRIKVMPVAPANSPSQTSSSTSAATSPPVEEIWALVEFEMMQAGFNDSHSVPSMADYRPQRYREWKMFHTEAELQDFIRRDTGEPITLPPYSLSPEQSAVIQQQAVAQVSQITEEFRRFRVRSEMSRKQQDAQIRELQNSHVQHLARRIEGSSSGGSSVGLNGSTNNTGMESHRQQQQDNAGEIERLRAEMVAQEAHWKEAYEVLLAENKALKSSGSEALLAAQWRQRYEAAAKEKEDLESRLNDKGGDVKWEAKYRDLKESFRLYRKKAKEIFEQQQLGGGGVGGTGEGGGLPLSAVNAIATSSSADAKLSYLKNLMVNYFTAEPTMRDPMETAIGTVLQFTPEELEKIEKKKAESWF